MNIAVVSDLHGLRPRFEKARRLLDEGIEILLIAGDIATMDYPEAQQANARKNFEFMLQGMKDIKVYAIPGNDDWKIIVETLQEFPEIIVPLEKAFPLANGFSVIGYPYVPITPFNVKDYEKWDSSEYPELPVSPKNLEKALLHHRINLEGLRSKGLELYDFHFNPQDRTENITKDMNRLKELSDPKTTVYLFHCPPYLEHESVQIGSRSISGFIKNCIPWITVHGHSHGAVDRMNGKFIFEIGETKSALVGAGNDPNVLSFITLDIKRRLIERHKI